MEEWWDLDVDWENIRRGANFAVQELARAFGVDDEPESLRNLLTEELAIEGCEEQIKLAGDYSWALNQYVYWRRAEGRLRWMLAGAVAFYAQDDKKRLATTYNNIGLIYDAQGSYDEALQWYMKDLEITEQIGDRAGLATTYNNIASIHYAQGSYDEALQWYMKDLEITEQIGDRAGLATTLGNMGVLEMERGQLQRALEYFSRSRDLYERIGLEKDVALVEEALAEVRRRMEQVGE